MKDKAAAVCVMDIYNGDIVSLVSSPTFEPNEFVHGLDKEYWNSLIKNEKNHSQINQFLVCILQDQQLKH